MIGIVLALALLGSPAASTAPAAPVAKPQSVRVEKLTAAEVEQLTAAKKAVSDAEAKLAQAKRNLTGTEQGIEEAHHANTDCGCYLNTEGLDFDKVKFEGDKIVIQHVHEAAPPSLGAAAGNQQNQQQ